MDVPEETGNLHGRRHEETRAAVHPPLARFHRGCCCRRALRRTATTRKHRLHPNAGRLVTISDFRDDGVPFAVTFGTYREVRARSRVFDDLAVTTAWQPTLTGLAEPECLDGQRVSASNFATLGVGPAIGRGFDAGEDRPGGAKEVVLSDALWRRRFGADSAILGQRLTLDGTQFTVTGVMPRAFENVASPSAQLWTLLQFDPALPIDEQGHRRIVVRRDAAGSSDLCHNDWALVGRVPRRLLAARVACGGRGSDGRAGG